MTNENKKNEIKTKCEEERSREERLSKHVNETKEEEKNIVAEKQRKGSKEK